jgi:hypothetical protein
MIPPYSGPVVHELELPLILSSAQLQLFVPSPNPKASRLIPLNCGIPPVIDALLATLAPVTDSRLSDSVDMRELGCVPLAKVTPGAGRLKTDNLR